MSVGENIRRYRKSRGMTQAQLAEAVGLPEGAVRHYESGIRAVKPALLESISLNPKAPHAPKAAMAIELWAEKRAQLENGEIDAAEYEDWKASL